MVIGVNYNEFFGQGTYESVRLSYKKEGDSEFTEEIFDSGDFVADWNSAVNRYNDLSREINDGGLYGSSTVDDFLSEPNGRYHVSESTGLAYSV
jgi:hypothetical protein